MKLEADSLRLPFPPNMRTQGVFVQLQGILVLIAPSFCALLPANCAATELAAWQPKTLLARVLFLLLQNARLL